jgi:succinyl-diaminopimelate desuccinylase
MDTNALSAIELTRKLIGFKTINPPGDETGCIEFLADLLSGGGFKTRLYHFAPGRASLVATLGKNGRRLPLCFAGHVDTVPLGSAAWQREPFAGTIEDGKIYGRGASDMKSGIAALVVAALEAASQIKGQENLILVIVGGEETGCEGSFHLAGLDGVLEKAGGVIVAEPTSNFPLVGHKGALWLKAATEGVTAHGSMPECGVNAIYKAARAVDQLTQFDFGVPPHPHLGKPTLSVGTISGGMNINSVPDAAEIGIDLRTIPGINHADLLRELAVYLGPEVSLEPVIDVEGIWTDPQHPWIQEVYHVLTPILGQRPEPKTVAFFTDAAALTQAYPGAPIVILGPGEPQLAHQTDEYCFLSRIEEAVETYRQIAGRWYGIPG